MMSTKNTYRVGWVRVSPRHPIGPQIDAMRRADIEKVYGATNGEDVMSALKHLRGRGQSEIVVTSLGRLGSSREAIRAAIDAARERGVAVVELSTGRRSDDASVAVQMALDAADEIAADRRAFTRKEARAAARKRWEGAEPPKRTSIEKAGRVWRDTAACPTIQSAVDHADCAGWTQDALYKQFGARWPKNSGRGGRPRKS